MAYHLLRPKGFPLGIAPSLSQKKRGIGTSSLEGHHIDQQRQEDMTTIVDEEPGNPTCAPWDILKQFDFTFLIRHPRFSIPSLYRCSVPPLVELTRFDDFDPIEAGYRETRLLFDFLRSKRRSTSTSDPGTTGQEVDEVNSQGIFVLDADDLMDNPSSAVEAFCAAVGYQYDPDMLHWDSEERQKKAQEAFQRWPGWHEDALDSTELRARTHVGLQSRKLSRGPS